MSRQRLPAHWAEAAVSRGPRGGARAGLSSTCAQQDIDMYIAHMRQHEYPKFMSFQMSQGVPRDQAHGMYSQWESMRVDQRIRDMNMVPT